MTTNEVEQAQQQPEKKMRTVMVAAPSYDGSVNVYYASALAECCKIGLMYNINVVPFYIAYDALIQRARNDIFKVAYDSKVDDLVFIDCDVDWNPTDLFKLLSHDVEIVGAAVVKKSDFEQYAVKVDMQNPIDPEDIAMFLGTGLAEVAGLGFGFLRVRSDAIEKIWNYSDSYTEPHKPEPVKMVFNVGILDGELCSEDIYFCESWRQVGGKIYVDPAINVSHTGVKRWTGNFYDWIKRTSAVRQE